MLHNEPKNHSHMSSGQNLVHCGNPLNITLIGTWFCLSSHLQNTSTRLTWASCWQQNAAFERDQSVLLHCVSAPAARDSGWWMMVPIARRWNWKNGDTSKANCGIEVNKNFYLKFLSIWHRLHFWPSSSGKSFANRFLLEVDQGLGCVQNLT